MSEVKKNLLAGILLLAMIPVATVSATTYTDNFDRPDSATLGPNWSNVNWSFTSGGFGISSGMAYGDRNAVGSYYNAVQLVAEEHVRASVEFRASNSTANNGVPNLWFGFNYNGTAANPYDGPAVMIQGTVGCGFAVDGNWRDPDGSPASLSTPLTPGEWYKLAIEQNGADFTATLTSLDGLTEIMQQTYTSLVQTTANGYAYIGQSTFSPYVDNTPLAFENFTLTVVPEPISLSLFATGVVGIVARRRTKR